MTPRSSIPAVILAASLACGCAASSGDRVARDLATARSERAPDKLVARGRAFARVGDLMRAQEYLAAALDAGADSGRVLPELLRVCVAAHQYRAAIDYATPYLDRQPGDVRLRFVVAELRVGVGDTSGARADLEKVLAAEPSDAGTHFAYGRLLHDEGNLLEADREFRAYLRLAPSGEHADEARASLLRPVAPEHRVSLARGGRR